MAKLFLALCAFALLAAVAVAQPADEDIVDIDVDFDGDFDDDLEDEHQRGFKSFLKSVGKGLLKYVSQEFIDKINPKCFYDLPGKCGWNVFSGKFYKCALAYFEDNKDRCLKN